MSQEIVLDRAVSEPPFALRELTPVEMFLQLYQLPFTLFPEQVDVTNDLAVRNHQGYWLDMGTGKTVCATITLVYHMIVYGHKGVVVLPPLLRTQWVKWLRGLQPMPGVKPLRVVDYGGSPAQRAKISLDADIVVVGIQIFKKDYARFVEHFQDQSYSVCVDEADMLSNPHSDNHEKVFEFSVGHPQLLLTGTPTNGVMDAYGILKFTAPGAYRNLRHFENLHVEERDFFKKPTKFMNLDLLKTNLEINSRRILFEDLHKYVETPLFIPVEYDLEPDHKKLYKRLADEQLLLLPEGGKIDATSANRLTHMLGQIVVNFGHFSGDMKNVSNSIKLLDQTLHELNGKKLVIFAHYKMTVALLVQYLGKSCAGGINGDATETQKNRALQAFIEDPTKTTIVIQVKSGGKGLDGMQHVCHDAFFIEPCQQPRDFHQAVARLKRTGQRNRVRVRMGIASGTTQVRGFDNLLNNDETVNKVIRNAVELRAVIFGE